MKKKLSFLFFAILFSTFTFAQKIMVKGIVVDNDSKEALTGVTIFDPISKAGATTNLDGTFSLKVAKDTKLTVSYVGYIKKEVNAVSNLGTIALENNSVGLKQVEVSASVAIARKTPVAMSVINSEILDIKLGTQEFPEILNTTPGVYATKQGGGYGDSRYNIRGFESPNVAFMVNGVPVNDMEWGGVYMSNWAGLTDVLRSMQVQRGLGAAKISVPSIGGSVNILTRTTDAKKGGSISYGMGPDGYNKIGFTVSTGLSKSGWAMTVLGAKTWSNGYIQGTDFTAYSWFFNLSKRINDNQEISFTAFAAPQVHGQRPSSNNLLVKEWENRPLGYKYNPSYGYGLNGRVIRPENRYNKPQLSLNHYWTINDKSSLSSVLYLSIGHGSGSAFEGSKSYNDARIYGGVLNGVPYNQIDPNTGQEIRNPDGSYNFAQLEVANSQNVNGSQVVGTRSVNDHLWTGLISTYKTKLGQNVDFYGGIDLRYYAGLHQNVISDLMGGQFFVDKSDRGAITQKPVDYSYINQKLTIGDVVYRNYTGYVTQVGVFGQAEYSKGPLNLFVSGSLSNSSYWKIDRFYYDNAKSAVGNFIGFNLKGGGNYNFDEHNNVFINGGYMSRAPFMSGGYFTSITTSNNVNKNAVNEKSYAAEIGYGYTSKYFTAKVNGYYTMWLDKTTTKAYGTGGNANVNLTGVNSLHEGIELECEARPAKNLKIRGMLSVGNYVWKNDAGGVSGSVYTINGQPADFSGNPVTDGSGPAKITVDMNDVKVGNSAQTTASLGASYRLLHALTFGADYVYRTNNYANYGINPPSSAAPQKYYTPWELPAAGYMNFYASYKFKIGPYDATLNGNINNLLNTTYMTDGYSLSATTPKQTEETTAIYYGFGQTWSVGLKVRF